MAPAVAENGSVLVDRVAYHIRSPKKGDVVAFTPKGNTSANDNVKRIVAVPGDTVQIEVENVGVLFNSVDREDESDFTDGDAPVYRLQ